PPFTLSLALFTALCGMVALSSSLIGHLVDDMKFSERVVLFMGGLLMIYPEAATDLAGLAILAGSVFLQRRRKKAART
ncbi:MAG: TRAP transporter permease, partial [Negativicutes bacterium]